MESASISMKWIIIGLLVVLGIGIAVVFLSRAKAERSQMEAHRSQIIAEDHMHEMQAEMDRVKAEKAILELKRKELEAMKKRRLPRGVR